MPGQHGVLQVAFFGGFALTYDGEHLPPLASRHARLLFAWLVLQGGRPQARTLLCDRFWPDVTESRARRRLSHALWQVQDAFGERGPQRPYLLTPGDHIQFDASAPYQLDVEEFEQRLDEVDRADASDAVVVRHLRRCVDLYQGDLLAGHYEDWVLREQERLRQRHITALHRLVDACKQRGNFEEALQVARRLTHQAPLREEAHREVMRLCVLVGQPGQAIEQFDRCRSVLAEELDTEPSPATVELHERISRRRGAEAPRRAPVEELASDRLVARDDERVALVDQLERTLTGSPGMVLLEGEPGIGKTQLLAQAVDDARWRGFTVLWGSCSGPDVPYAALRHAVLPELDEVRVAQLRALVAPVWLREASRLLPALAAATSPPVNGSAAPRPDLDAGDAAERMRQALAEVLVGLATIDPVVVVIEDLHRADQETLAVLRTLARHPDPGRLLVLLSYRDVDARQDDAVWTALRELDRDGRPARVVLEPLDVFETGALLREVLGAPQLPATFVQRIHRECGGNPLYVLELLRSLRDTGALHDDFEQLDTLDLPVTTGLRTLIRSRLGLLGRDAATVAEFAAVLGRPFLLATIQEALGMDPRRASGAVGELARRNLVQPDGTAWRFSHTATRRVLLDGLEDEAARSLHATAAEAIATTRPDEVESLAAHLLAAGERRRALPHLRAAADRAVELHAYATAARHLDAAMQVIDDVLVPVDEIVEVLLQAETVLDVLGRREPQGEVLDRLEQLVGEDAELVGEVRIRRAQHLGHLDELEEALDVARAAAEQSPMQLRGRALATVGELLHWRGHHEEAIATLHTALERIQDATPARRHAVYVLAAALRTTQHFEDARAILEDALTAARQHGDDVAVVRVLGGLADLDAETGRTADAVERYGEAVELARRIGFRHREAIGLGNLGTVRLARGEPAGALASLDEAERLLVALANHRGAAIVRQNRAWLLHRWLGRDDDAERDARAAMEHTRRTGATGLTAAALETLAGIARRRDDVDAAAHDLRTGLDLAISAGDKRIEVQLRRGRAELDLHREVPHDAHRTSAEAARVAIDLGMVEFVADLASLAGVAAARRGDHDEAAHWGSVASEHLATSPEPHLVHSRLAAIAKACDQPEVAATHHQQAFEHLKAWLADFDEADRAVAEAVPDHAAILEAGRAHAPRRVQVQMARSDAPRGRPLTPAETVDVVLELAPPATTPLERRDQVLHVLEEVEGRHATATVSDLATIFDVSASTIRRDLRALRRDGHDVITRGSDTG